MNELEALFLEIHKTRKSIQSTPGKLLKKYGVSRRGNHVIRTVDSWLNKYDLIATPAFGSAYVYGVIEISPIPKLGAKQSGEDTYRDGAIPTLSILRSANLNNIEDESILKLISVNRDTALTEAITLMIKYDFSQLPILSGRSDVEGLISWKSIGRALVLGKECNKVRDCKEDALIFSLNEPLFKVVKTILEKDAVLIRDKDKKICGIVTATDVGEHFISLSEPFLLLEQIENLIRKILADKFTKEDISHLLELEKELNDLSELTFGQYIRIIENPTNFQKLKIKIDRGIFIEMLKKTCDLRNEVMHFNPDPIQDEEIEQLRQTLTFLTVIVTNL